MKIELRLTLRVKRERPESAAGDDEDPRGIADLSGTTGGDYERAEGLDAPDTYVHAWWPQRPGKVGF